MEPDGKWAAVSSIESRFRNAAVPGDILAEVTQKPVDD